MATFSCAAEFISCRATNMETKRVAANEAQKNALKKLKIVKYQ